MLSAKQFYNKYLGGGYDIDGSYGCQCVDLFKIFMKEYLGTYCATGGSGYASGYWESYESQSLLKNNFKKVSVSELQNGDWCIWKYGSKACPLSHIAMYYNGKFLGMNQNGYGVATLASISTSGMYGALRPNCYKAQSTGSGTSVNGGATVAPKKWNRSCANGVQMTVIPKIGLNLRKGPGTSYDKIVTLPKGTKVYYYGGYGGTKPNWWIWVGVYLNGKYYEGWVKPNDGNTLYLKGYEI